VLHLTTGLPGSGKSLYTLWYLYKTYRENVEPKDRRPLYINGVPELDYEFFQADELEDPEKWYELPEGSLIFIDEAQRVFPQRPPSAPVPPKCRQFETHRHRGYDIFVTTQDANTLDVHLRRLTGKHYHLRRVLGQEFATLIEYEGYQSKPMDYFSKKEATSSKPWNYPKAFFERYKSATLHTVKKRFPLKLFVIPVAFIAMCYLAYLAFNTIGSFGDEPEGEVSITNPMGIVQGDRMEPKIKHTITSWTNQFKPIVPGVLHSAPIYQEVFKVETFPVPSCIIYQSSPEAEPDDSCLCKTQQSTRYDTTPENCRFWAKNGFFNPTVSESTKEAHSTPNASAWRGGAETDSYRISLPSDSR